MLNHEYKLVDDTFYNLKKYIEKNKFKGWDPYDALNAEVLKKIPFSDNKYFRITWTQLVKRCPVNLRPFLSIKKGYNPKALALILSGYCNLIDIKIIPDDEREIIFSNIKYLSTLLIQNRNTNYSGACWGYNFDWNSKAFFLPKHTPTIVATTFVVDSLLKAFRVTKDKSILSAALSSKYFVIEDLNRIKRDKNLFMFSYSPIDNQSVYNASLLATKLLSMVYSYEKDLNLKELAYTSAKAVCNTQKENGAFNHSDQVGDRWRDSFHTGFKIECLSFYRKLCNDESLNSNLETAITYWIKNFFLENGTPKYYDNKLYPIDLHCTGQMIPTLYHADKLGQFKELVIKTLNWSIENMYDKKLNYFYFQKRRFWTNKIEFMRWPNAWMFYSLSYFLKFLESE